MSGWCLETYGLRQRLDEEPQDDSRVFYRANNDEVSSFLCLWFWFFMSGNQTNRASRRTSRKVTILLFVAERTT